jgi:hypothetical protein
MERTSTATQTGGFWQAVSAALAALARKSGCSLLDSPLPEIREAARDWRDRPGAPHAGGS